MAEIVSLPRTARGEPGGKDPEGQMQNSLTDLEHGLIRLEGLVFCQRELVRMKMEDAYGSDRLAGIRDDFDGLFSLSRTIEDLVDDLTDKFAAVHKAAMRLVRERPPTAS